MATISGNVGSSSAQGVGLTLSPRAIGSPGGASPLYTSADSNGNFTFTVTGLPAGMYRITATTGNVTSGPYESAVYSPVDVQFDGSTSISNVGFQAPVVE
jgi:hypothetical protein